MKHSKVFLTIGLSALLAVAAAGCGGGAPSGGSGGSGGSSAPSSSPAWGGAGAWNNLTKLTNYSFQTTVNYGGSTMTMTEEQHDPHNYQMSMGQGGQTMTFILAGGHNYMATGSGGYLDLGASDSSSASSGLQQAASTWQGFLGGNGASYAGPCSVAGRLGNSFNLKVTSSMLGAAVSGISGSTTGNACVDTATGVLLSSDIKWTESVKGKSITFADTFKLTGMGNVPVIQVPTGATSLPSGQ